MCLPMRSPKTVTLSPGRLEVNIGLGLLSSSAVDIALVSEEIQHLRDSELVLPPRTKQVKHPLFTKLTRELLSEML